MNYTIKEIKKICIKKGGPLYARIFVRKVAVYITWLFVRTSITPNQVTFLSLLMGLIGSGLLFFGTYKYSILAVIFLQLRTIFDSVDGELARVKKKTSIIGHYYDRLIHGIVETIPFVAIGYVAYYKFDSIIYFLLAFSIILSVLMMRLITAEKYRLYYEHKLYPEIKKEKREKITKKITILSTLKLFHDKIGFLFRHPALFNVLTILAIFNILHWSLYFYGIVYPFITLGSFIYESFFRFRRLE